MPLALVVSEEIYWGVVKHEYDGIRQDTWPYVPRTFWRDWMAATRLAGGDLSAEVETRRGGDEIGQMAQALSVFREGIVQANAAAAQKAAEQEAKQRQAAVIDQLTREFNDGATNALAAVSTAASRMKGSAEKMSRIAPGPNMRPSSGSMQLTRNSSSSSPSSRHWRSISPFVGAKPIRSEPW